MTVMESLKLQISIDLAFGDKVSFTVRIDGDVVPHSHESSGFHTPDLKVRPYLYDHRKKLVKKKSS